MSDSKRPKRLCIMTTVPWSITMLCRGQLPYFIEAGWQVTCVSGRGDEFHENIRRDGARSVQISIVRKPSPLRDFWTLICLWWFFLFNRFDVIHISTPKAMLLGTIAARLAGQNNIVITMRGRAFENITGWKKKLFIAMDRLVYSQAKRIIPICRELGDLIVAEGCKAEKIRFLGASSNGLNSEIFSPNKENISEGQLIRQKFGIATDDLVILFVGRLRRDKGVNELVRAFELLNSTSRKLHLVLLGPRETTLDPLDAEVEEIIARNDRIHTHGQHSQPAFWYAMADILAFPSYREGFGNVALEAAAMELPVVSTNIMGPREAVADGLSGILVEPMTIQPLANALQSLIDDPDKRYSMGQAGRKRAINEFKPKTIWDGILNVYSELLAGNK